MKKLLIFVILATLFIVSCATEDKELKSVIKVTPNQTVKNITPVPPEANITANVSQNITNITVANITNTTSNLTNTTANATANTTTTTSPAALKNLSVEFLNQFEGNSILITTPKNKRIVIDGGSNHDGLYLVKYLLSKGIYKVDYIFASNAMEDNVGGLDSLILNYNETSPFYSGLQYANYNAYRNYINYAAFVAHTMTVVNKTKEISLDDTITFTVFVPFTNQSLGTPKDDTLVFKLEYEDSTFLFLGDCTGICLENIKGNDLKADIVKTNKELSNETLEIISPKVIVFSQKPENFTTTAKVYSKEDGIVRVISDGEKYYITAIPQS